VVTDKLRNHHSFNTLLSKFISMSELRTLLEFVDMLEKNEINDEYYKENNKIIDKASREKLITCQKRGKGYYIALNESGHLLLWQMRLDDSSKKLLLWQMRLDDTSRDLTKLTSILLLVTILLLAVSVATIYSNYDIFYKEREQELRNHINDLKALEYELNMNLGFICSIEEKEAMFLNKSSLIIFSRFINENLEKEVADGRIEDNATRGSLIATLHHIYEINDVLDGILYNPELATNMTKKLNIESQVFDKIKTELKGNMTKAKNYVSLYISRLEKNSQL